MFTAIAAAALGIPAAGLAGAAAWPAVIALLAKLGVSGAAATEIAGVAVPIVKQLTTKAVKDALTKPLDEETRARIRASRERHFRDTFP